MFLALARGGPKKLHGPLLEMFGDPCYRATLLYINTMRFFHKTKPLIRMYTIDSCQIWLKNSKNLRPDLANRKGVVLQQDNARPHVSLTTRTRLHELGWDLLPHTIFI